MERFTRGARGAVAVDLVVIGAAAAGLALSAAGLVLVGGGAPAATGPAAPVPVSAAERPPAPGD